MREACRQTSELAADNADTLVSYQEYLPLQKINKQSIVKASEAM